MLNKLTLTFKDSRLENIYQEYLTSIIRRPLLLKLIINSATFIIISLIERLVKNSDFFKDTQQLLIFGINVLQIFFFLFIYKRMPKSIKWVILLYNHILLVYYYNTKVLKHQEQILTVQGIMILQIINGLATEFLLSVYQIVLFSTCYMIFAFLEDPSIDYSLIVQILSAIMILTSSFYQYIKALRCQFQLCNIDNQWEQIFTSIIKDQYMIFQYHENNLCFTLKNQENFYQNVKNTEDLRNFLREAKITQQTTLEQFLFHKIKNNSDKKNIINQKQPILLDKKISITYSIFYGVQTILLLQIQNASLYQRSKQYSIEKMYQTRFKQFILQIKNVIKRNSIKFNLVEMKFQVRKFCLYAYLKDLFYYHSQDQLDKYITMIQCKSIVKTLQSIHHNKNITFENCITTDFVGCKQLILIILIEIIEKSLSQFISLRFEKVCSSIFQINVFCLYEEKKNPYLFNWIQQYPKHIHLIKCKQQCNYMSLYQDVCLQFYTDYQMSSSKLDLCFLDNPLIQVIQ